MSNRLYQIVSTVVLLGLFLGGFPDYANAAFNRSLDYAFSAERNTEEDDENFSTLTLKLDDDFYTTRYRGTYELESLLFADHDENETNDQHEGKLSSQYIFVESGFWWVLDGSVGTLPIETGVEIDEFNSQTITSVSTGPVLSIRRGLRGSVDLALSATSVQYSETELDSTETSGFVRYQYPVSPKTNWGAELGHRSLEYDDEINQVNDFDISLLRVFFDSRAGALEYNLSVSFNTIDSESDPDDQSSYQVNIIYVLNSFSTLRLEVADSLQTAGEFDLLPGNLEESQFDPGLLRNKRVSLGYDYFYSDLTAGVLIFRNDIENIVFELDEDDTIEGWSLYLENRFNPNLLFRASYEHTETEATGIEEDDLEMAIIYSLVHSSRFTSSFELFGELETVDETDFDNAGVRYTFTSNLFR